MYGGCPALAAGAAPRIRLAVFGLVRIPDLHLRWIAWIDQASELDSWRSRSTGLDHLLRTGALRKMFLRPGSREQGAVAQLGERLICIQEAVGSIPISSTSDQAGL